MKLDKKWFFPLFIVLAIAVIGLFSPHSVNPEPGEPAQAADIAWMLTASGLVLLMTPGLSFFYGGMVTRKNVISTLLQSFVSLGVISILWVFVGFSLTFGDSIGGEGTGLIGNPFTFFMFQGVDTQTHLSLSPTIPLVLFALFQLKFAIITPALITGAFAERVRFSSYLLFITLFCLLIYCPIAHWTWHPNGFLRKWGVLDFAGGTVVHMVAGFAALAGALALGRRENHLKRETHSPANIPFVVLGTGMLWFGWFGFNAGSAFGANEIATQAFLTTNTASAAGMITWIFFDGFLGRKPSALGACIGAVVGLVAITPAAGFVTVGDSLFIGCSAALVSNFAVHIKTKSTLDDTLDVFPCHGVGGIWGMLLTGILAKKSINEAGDDGLLMGNSALFIHHLYALIIVGTFAFVGSYLLFKLVNKLLPMRVTFEQEQVGLDISQHGEKM